MAEPVRLNRYLARAGIASRRKADDWIAAGRIAVNGAPVTTPGAKVDPESNHVTADGRPVRLPAARVWRYYKPRGVVASLDDDRDRRDLGKLRRRMDAAATPVGRLDRDSEGLLLWTTQGDWIAALTHPRYGAEKRYRVTVAGRLPADLRERLAAMDSLPDGTPLARPAQVTAVDRRGPKSVVEVALQEGKNRQLRQMFGALDLDVRRLVRIAEAGVELGDLRPGQLAELEPREVAALGRYVDSLLAAAPPRSPREG